MVKRVNYSRRCIQKISETWKCLEDLMGDDFNVEMAQTPQQIEDNYVAINHD